MIEALTALSFTNMFNNMKKVNKIKIITLLFGYNNRILEAAAIKNKIKPTFTRISIKDLLEVGLNSCQAISNTQNT